LSIAVIFSVPSSDLAGRREPDLAVTLSVSDKLAEEMRAERPPADKWVIPPDHELGIRLTFFVETIETVLPHLQEISRCSSRSLITGVVIEVLNHQTVISSRTPVGATEEYFFGEEKISRRRDPERRRCAPAKRSGDG
jgi:hypothetical protein